MRVCIDGSHPFYLEHQTNGKSHGVFLRNSNGMDVILDKSSLTYNVLGGQWELDNNFNCIRQCVTSSLPVCIVLHVQS